MLSPASADKHYYQRCTDDNCPRFPCHMYKESFVYSFFCGFD